MRKTKKTLKGLSLVACLLVALLFGGSFALAVGAWWTPGGNTLTVTAESNEHLMTDISSGGVTVEVDVYKVAKATAQDAYQAFDYELVGPFATEDMQQLLNNELNGSDSTWENFSKAAAELVKNAEEAGTGTIDPAGTGAIGTDGKVDISLDEDGLYLVLPHGKGVTDGSLVAYGTKAQYTFTPSCIALPTKYNEGYESAGYLIGEVRTDGSYGEWNKTVIIALKAAEEPLYGDLKIIKEVADFSGEPATFVFHIKSTPESPYEYENYASVYYASGKSQETIVRHIKAGTIVTVAEEDVYEGARFEYESGDTLAKEIVSTQSIGADDTKIVSVTFKNKSNDHGISGHGIQNTFTWTSDGDWNKVEATPSDAKHDKADDE